MTPPDAMRIFGVIDATWPPVRHLRCGPWHLREGKGGGQRVSAATAESPVSETDIAVAEAGMKALGQTPLFMVRQGENDLDDLLNTRRYSMVDPVTIYLTPARDLAKAIPAATAVPSWPPLAIQSELWSAAGIGPARLAVMDRASEPKTALLGRCRDEPAGVAFVAIDDDVAMLHALEVMPDARRKGVATRIIHGAAKWALAKGAIWLAVIVTRANGPGNTLYRKLGMGAVTSYHYRRAPEAAT